MNKKHYAYLVKCTDNSYYGGYTTNPIKREKDHNTGKGAKYTRSRLPVELVYFEEFDEKSDALKREASLKKLSHQEKETLSKQFNLKAHLPML